MAESNREMLESILALKKQLATAAAGKKVDEIKTVLQKLREVVVPSEEVIRNTKIGISVGKQRNNADPEVAKLAKAMVTEWKKTMDAQPKKDTKKDVAASESPHPNEASPGASPSVSLSQAPTPGPSKPSASPAPTTTRRDSTPAGKPRDGPRSAKTEGVKFDFLKDPTRDKCMELVFEALVFDSQAPSEQIVERAREVERQCHLLNKDSTAYRNKMRSLFLNLKDPKNPGLREAVVSGDLDARKLCTMNPTDMASEERKAQDRKLHEHNLFNARGAEAPQAETDAFQCGKCHQRKTTYRQQQTRSADEPMTTFVTCVNCGNRWKFC